jgi:hypothetical protein
VGAVEYLQRRHFKGKVLAPFTAGGYVSWWLAPEAKVAFDGRYEVAYPAEVARKAFDFYAGGEHWHDMLDAYPPDVIMVMQGTKAAAHVRGEAGWKVVYQDDAYLIFTGDTAALLPEDSRGVVLRRGFP